MSWLMIGLAAVVVVETAVLLVFGLTYLRTLTHKAKQEQLSHVWWTLQGAARTFVLAAVQLYAADENGSKRDYVLRRLQELADNLGIPVKIEQLEAMLESAVKDMALDLAGRSGPPDVFSN